MENAFFTKVRKLPEHIKRHKGRTVVIAILVVIVAYWGYSKLFPATPTTRYTTTTVAKDTIISTISATGQVSASTQLELKPKVSANIVKILVKSGDSLKQGDVIAKLDSTDAEKAVRDANNQYKAAKLSYDKLVEPADALSMTQSQNALADAQTQKQSAQEALTKAYNDGYSNVAATFLDLSSAISGVHDILFTQHGIGSYTDSVDEYNVVNSAFQVAQTSYDKNLIDYKGTSLYSDNTKISALIDETIGTTQTMAKAIKAATAAIQDKITNQNLSTDARTTANIASLNTYTDKMNADIQSLTDSKNALRSNADTIASAERTITEKTQSLDKLKTGADTLDIQSSQLSVTQKANALQDAIDNLSDYTIRAPFDCVVASIPVNVGDPASGGTTIATLITKQQLATVALNEVDVAKVKMGEKATVTFDAIPDLTISAKVSEIDSVGTVSQGVVNYNVQLAFDTQDSRVKPGMSMTASIITAIKTDTLVIPSTAVKTKNGTSQVSKYVNDAPVPTTVTIGITSDSMTEILSGLKEGDTIVTQTITSASTASANSSNSRSNSSSMHIPGLGGGGGPRG